MIDRRARPIERIAVLGAGAWGSALAIAALRAGRAVTLWSRNPEQAALLAESRVNGRYLPGIELPPAIAVTSELRDTLDADALLLTVPAQELRALAERLAPLLPEGRPLVICAKGIEESSGLLMTEALAETVPQSPLGVLTGPSFAGEVARGLPTALTLATADARLGEALLTALGSRTFRPYLSDDPIGAQVGGALKNVIAIACGAVAGRGLGENARAALVTRGLAELVRFGGALGGAAETLMGLSGFGDLTLTCTSAQSRNYRLGLALGRGEIRSDDGGELAEGVATAEAALKRAARHQVELPITEAVAAVLAGRRGLDETIQGLLSRPLKSETP